MATLRPLRKRKDGNSDAGYVVSVQEFRLNMSIQTNTRNKSAAKLRLNEIQTRLDEVKKDKSHVFRSWTKEEQRGYIRTGREPQTEDKKLVTLSDAVKSYLHHQRTIKKNTDSYCDSLESTYLTPALAHFGNDFPIEDMTHKRLQDYVTKYAQTPITRGSNVGSLPDPASQAKYLNKLKYVFDHMITKQHMFELNNNIFMGIDYVSKDENQLSKVEKWCGFEQRIKTLDAAGISHDTENAFAEVAFEKDELDDLVGYLQMTLWESGTFEDRRLFVAILFCICTGCRRSSLIRLKKCDINIEDGTAVLHRKKGRKGKVWNRHTVEWGIHSVSNYLKELLNEIQDDDTCVFAANNKHVRSNGFDENIEKRLRDKLSRDYRKALRNSKWQHIGHFHSFRHTLASLLLATGHTQTQIKDMIGWCSDDMVKRYAHQKRKALSADLKFALTFNNQLTQG